MEEKELIIKLRQLEAQEDLQTAQLSANGSVLQLESLLSDNSDKNVHQINTDQTQKSSQHLNDQLNASKQLVQQQSHIMEKIRNQLEDTPSPVREKDKVIHAFKMCSSNTSNDLLKLQVQTQTIQPNHFNSIESEVFNSSNYFDDEELGLNRLFNSLTNDQFEEFDHFKDKQIDSINKKPENDVTDDCSDSYDCKKSAELIPLDSTESDNHSIRSNASSKNSYYAENEINHKSDVSIGNE